MVTRGGEITKVFSPELSMLGRNTIDVRNIIRNLGELDVCTHIVNKNLRSLDKHRKKDSITVMILGILADLREMKWKQQTERVISGLEEAKHQGMALGRRKGTTKPAEALLKENKRAVEYLRIGRSIRETAKLCDIAPNTVMKIKRSLPQ